jgi:hypothetical protein
MLEQLSMLKSIDKRSYKITKIIVWVSVVLLVVPICVFIKGIILENEFGSIVNKLIIYEPKSHKINPPSEIKLAYLSRQLNALKERYPSIKDLSTALRIKQQKNEAVGSALAFKEELFNLKQSLEEKARVIAIPFPEEYGLQEYETQLPRDEDLPQLFFYIDLVKFFMTLLIELPVEKIEYLRFADVTTQPFATHDAERYSSFTTEIVFNSSYVALLRFLNGIQNAPEIHTINSISIAQSAQKDAAEGDLEIALSISTFSIINN